MAGSSAMHFARAAYRSGMVSRARTVQWGMDHLRFRIRGADESRTQGLLAVVEELLSGVPERDIARMAPDMLAGILPRLYPQMIDEVHAHQDAGRPAFIVSAAGNELVGLLAQVLGFEGGIGTRYEVTPDGILTGKIAGPFIYGEGKVVAMRGFAEEHGIEMAQSWAYSDAVSDLPMLRSVGNAVAVNPDAELRAVAEQEGWRVMDFERLGRRLTIAAATLVAAAVGGSGTAIARRRSARTSSRRRRSRPRPRRR
jgi:HAD superfamily hydrolase (TIGR01490 family)